MCVCVCVCVSMRACVINIVRHIFIKGRRRW